LGRLARADTRAPRVEIPAGFREAERPGEEFDQAQKIEIKGFREETHMIQAPRRSLATALSLAAATLAMALAPGCGEEAAKPSVASSNEEVTVKGTVTFKGKPVTKGEVAFDPSNYIRKSETARRVTIGPDGVYTVKTLAGTNRVSFAIPEMSRDPSLQDLSLQYEAPSGESTFDIKLPPEQPPTTP
jgi:hypothetical protein